MCDRECIYICIYVCERCVILIASWPRIYLFVIIVGAAFIIEFMWCIRCVYICSHVLRSPYHTEVVCVCVCLRVSPSHPENICTKHIGNVLAYIWWTPKVPVYRTLCINDIHVCVMTAWVSARDVWAMEWRFALQSILKMCKGGLGRQQEKRISEKRMNQIDFVHNRRWENVILLARWKNGRKISSK